MIYTVEPRKQDFRVTFLDQNIRSGTSYYYLRVIQADHQLAWSSPIWVNYKRN